MTRRVSAWLLTIPLAVAGTQLAHEAAYRMLAPDSLERTQLLDRTGHAYFAYAPVLLGFGAALVLASLLVSLLRTLRGSAATHLSPWAFAALAPLGFTLQEHVERLLHEGAVPWDAALEPTFMLGLVLQLPFTLAAYVFARALLAVAEQLGRALSAGRPFRARRLPARRRRPADVSLIRLPVLALGHAGRGPPRS
jgi:hypothetical protein